jgi:DNA-binding NarL/FixJ family response regulator
MEGIMSKVIRVLLADDHPPLRVGLRVLLNQAPDVEVVAEAGSGQDALALLESHQPDVVVLDCQLPDMDGVEVAAEVQRRGLPVKVLALSAYADDPYVQGMMAAGAVGYLLKEEAPGAIVDAVRATARGEGSFSAAVAVKMTAWAREEKPTPPIADLTGREREVLQLLAKGWDNQRIAKELEISERTVRFHLRNAYDKIGVNSRTEAAVWAVRQGLREAE